MKSTKKFLKIISALCALVAICLGMASCYPQQSENAIRIVHKNYTEQRLVAQMLSEYLTSKGYETTVSELGGTMLCFNALNTDQADIHMEYTGTAYATVLHQTEVLSAEETYDYVRREFQSQYGITWAAPLGFNNTYVLSVTSEFAEKNKVSSISDLLPLASNLVIGSDTEFATRTDGMQGLLEAYPGLSFKKHITMDQGLTYNALHNGDLDVNVSYSTDGRIAKFDLVNLEDDHHFFPPYYCVPIVKDSCLDKNPGLLEALNQLKDVWSESDMQRYNLAVDEGKSVKDVAHAMLVDAGLIS